VIVLSYAEAVSALDRAQVFGINPSLDGIGALCESMDRPQDSVAAIQIAGTNGKTSTARLTHEILLSQGIASGLYTSPELQRVNERIELEAGPADDEQFARAVSAAVSAAESLRPGAQGVEGGFTEFELTTAAALWLFRERQVEVAVLEVGLGGRWDATSVTSPALCAITGIGLDHAAILGDTLEAIAAEKAAIIRHGCTVVLGPGTAGLEHVFIDRASTVGASVIAVRELGADTPVAEESTVRYTVTSRPSSPGGSTVVGVTGLRAPYGELELATPAYQAANAATAIALAEAAIGGELDGRSLRDRLARVRLPGRFELMSTDPPIVIDGAHNPQAAGVLARAISDAWPDAERRPQVLLGVLADKDAEGIVAALAGVAAAVRVTEPRSARALAADELAAVVARVTGSTPVSRVPLEDALSAALPVARDGLVITGSLTTAGQARSALLDASATA